MTEHPTKQELDEYRARMLSPAAFLSVHRHVSACPHCAAECNPPKDLARDLDDLHAALLEAPDETPYHLSAAEVMAYARGTSNEIDLEIAESHLGVCQTCLSEVQRQTAAKGTPRRRVSSLMNWWQPWRVAAVLSCSVILILLAIWLLPTKPSEHKEQASGSTNLSSTQSSPAETQQSGTPEVLPNADLVLVLNDGKQRVTVDKHGSLAGLERLPLPIQEKIRMALQTGRLEQSSALAQLATQPSTLLSESDSGLPFQLVNPVGKVVRGKQPAFHWRALAGAQSYTVTVTDADLNEVASSPPLNTTEWRISKPLKEGGIYSWQVTALKNGVKITSPVLPAPQAKFKVIDRSTAELLQQAQRAYPDSHLTLGVLYAQGGLLDEAERELRVLVHNNPRFRIAQKLLENVKAMRAAQTSKT
jgi:hypothetical protein